MVLIHQSPQSPTMHSKFVAKTDEPGRSKGRSIILDQHSTARNGVESQEITAGFGDRDVIWRHEFEKKLVRRIDLHLMPFLILMFLLNFLDRSNLSQARQGSLEQDLAMSGTDFNLATSIFFVGYLIMQLPSNLIITRVRPSLYLATAVLLWGLVSTCNAAARNFHHLVAIRFFLGFVEAPFFPGAVFLMSSWYTRAELTRRIAWFYCGNTMASMFGGLVAYGILKNLSGVGGIAGWRWLFIVEGSATIGVAIVSAFFLPDYPTTTRWLNSEERAFATWRLTADIHEADETSTASVWQGLKLAFTDYRLYLFVLLTHLSILSCAFQYFFPTIVQTLGYGHLYTLLLTVPPWFAAFAVACLVNWTAARTGDRAIHICCLCIVAAIGNIISITSTSTGARFFAMFLMLMGAISAFTIVVSWVAGSFPRPRVKRSVVIAVANLVGNTANIYGSYMYSQDTGPRYLPGGIANAVICLLTGSLAIALRYLHKWENIKLQRSENRNGSLSGFRYEY
ncbi:hypothetical protein CDD82_5903 [Ophiocordyceps australis]|uniref:Major facilitator superfamily (MFS) profile domain-containing protein n=1 Tax=Ophiocordyceps australis TaxID=1399860 RepID=A0A2C5YST3_9HYPO|nr:hypothetical protein CDD82_5903 [Ophiocordyceps australis]